MAQRLLIIRFETGHALRAVPAGGDPYTEGTNLTDHDDGFYSVTLPAAVYDIYWKEEPDDPTWIQLDHYQGRFHPTDEITDDISEIQGDIDDLDTRVSALEGETPDTPADIESLRTPGGVHIKWTPQVSGTLFIVRGVYHHSDEQVGIDENSRILYSGYIPECVLSNSMRFADIESRPFSDIHLSFKIQAHTAAGESELSDVESLELDLTIERAEFCDSAVADCDFDSSSCAISYLTINYPGAFPKTVIDEQQFPTGEPARTISFPRDTRITRIEIESTSEAESDCSIYLCDEFSGGVYELKIDEGERFARSEETAAGCPSMRILRHPESKLYIYSDNAESFSDIEVRLTVVVILKKTINT